MNEAYDMPWMGGRDRTPIIEFGKWMRSRPRIDVCNAAVTSAGCTSPCGAVPGAGR